MSFDKVGPGIHNVNRTILQGTKKRRVMTQELMGKFRAKSDFIKYFSENRKNSTLLANLMSSVTLCATWENGQQRFSQARVHRAEVTASSQRSQMGECPALWRTLSQEVLADLVVRCDLHEIHARSNRRWATTGSRLLLECRTHCINRVCAEPHPTR